MAPTRLAICATVLVLTAAAAAPAAADPAYVPSNVNLRASAGTSSEVLAKIPAGTRLEVTNCADWCEVEWQGKKGFVIANALDRSGRTPAEAVKRAPAQRTANNARPRPRPRPYIVEDDDDYVPVGPPVVYRPYYYGYYGYRPYYYGYGYGYGRYRRW